MLDRLAIHDGTLEILDNCAVNGVALKHASQHSTRWLHEMGEAHEKLDDS